MEAMLMLLKSILIIFGITVLTLIALWVVALIIGTVKVILKRTDEDGNK